jgi:hypothetical protein
MATASRRGIEMRNAIRLSVICVAAMLGCTQPRPAPNGNAAVDELCDAWPKDWSVLLGKRVTIEGWAANAKLGALLYADKEGNGGIWIDRESWPSGYYLGQGKSKHVRVTGVVIRRDDVPVVLKGMNENGAPVREVESVEELNRVKWRFLLTEETWTVLD